MRLETVSAVKRDIPAVPVLVHGARMTGPEQVPQDLAELAYRNGVELAHARCESDVQVLIKALSPYVESLHNTGMNGAAAKSAPNAAASDRAVYGNPAKTSANAQTAASPKREDR